MLRPMDEAFRGVLSVLLCHVTGITGTLVGFKRCTSGIMAGGRVGRTYRDLTGRAMGLPIMVNTVLYIADNAFNVAARATSTLRIVHDRYHSLFIV